MLLWEEYLCHSSLRPLLLVGQPCSSGWPTTRRSRLAKIRVDELLNFKPKTPSCWGVKMGWTLEELRRIVGLWIGGKYIVQICQGIIKIFEKQSLPTFWEIILNSMKATYLCYFIKCNRYLWWFESTLNLSLPWAFEYVVSNLWYRLVRFKRCSIARVSMSMGWGFESL